MNCAGCGEPKGLSSCFLSPDLCARCDSEPRPKDPIDWLLVTGFWILVALVIASAVAR